MTDESLLHEGEVGMTPVDSEPGMQDARERQIADFIAEILPTEEELLLPREVAAAFKVEPKTIVRWANRGILHPVRTVGGTRRYRTEEVVGLIRKQLEVKD